MTQLHQYQFLRLRASAILSSLILLIAFPISSAHCDSETARQAEPETSTGTENKSLAKARRHLISTANNHASEAGLATLRRGGNATDAAIAAELVLGLVEPQSSGLGGGGFYVYRDQKTSVISTYDGRETAPKAAKPERFLDSAGAPIPFDDAVQSGLSIGTPGLIRLMETIHRAHGKLPWSDLFAPAIQLARNGFQVSPRLHYMLRWFGSSGLAPAAKAYFFDEDGSARAIGYLLKNPEYAATLEHVAQHGADVFYSGPIAEAIVAAVQSAPRHKGDLTTADLANYKVEQRAPLCVPYRAYRICGMSPPSSGGTAVAQIMRLIEPLPLGTTPNDAMNTQAAHIIVEAERLAYADRDRYLADPAFVAVPKGLTDEPYITERRALININKAMERAEPGVPPGVAQRAFGDDATYEVSGTTHLSVVDAEGNAAAFTATIEGAFGSGVWAQGFLLNNQLTDFSFLPADSSGRAIANRVEGGKRPRSTMAPTLVLRDNSDGNTEFVASLGSPGGSRIILYVVKALVGMLDWQLDAQQAINLPNFGSMGDAVEFEFAGGSIWPAIALKTGYGHRLSGSLMNSGLHAVVRTENGLEGAADPRREGTALGD